jgi:hypothetical protein
VSAYVGLNGVAHQHPAPGWDDALLIAAIAGAVVIVLTTSWLRDRRPTVQIGYQGGRPGIWLHGPARPVHIRRQGLRRRTERLISDWHRSHTLVSHPDDFAEFDAFLKAAPDRNAAWDEATALLLQLDLERRDRIELALRERVLELEAEYQRRGLLAADELTSFPEGELPSMNRMWRTDHLGMAMRRLEQLGGVTTDLPDLR